MRYDPREKRAEDPEIIRSQTQKGSDDIPFKDVPVFVLGSKILGVSLLAEIKKCLEHNEVLLNEGMLTFLSRFREV